MARKTGNTSSNEIAVQAALDIKVVSESRVGLRVFANESLIALC